MLYTACLRRRQVQLVNCSFSNNTAERGTVLVTNSAAVAISHSAFHSNNASRGAGICAADSCSLVVHSSSFLFGNGSDGAGIYADGGVNVSVTASLFRNSTCAVDGGGALTLDASAEVRRLPLQQRILGALLPNSFFFSFNCTGAAL